MTKMNKLESICKPVFGHGWQTKLAKYAGVNPRTVRRWITGELTLPEWMDPLLARFSPSLPDSFIIGEGRSGIEYIAHTHFPRFICHVGGEVNISGVTYETRGGEKLHSFVWLDMIPDEQTLSGILALVDDELK
jgi:hypothetical protein